MVKLVRDKSLQDVFMNPVDRSGSDSDGREERWMIIAEMSSVLGTMLHTLGCSLPREDPEEVASGFDDARHLLQLVARSSSDLAASLEALPPDTVMDLDLDAGTIDGMLAFMRFVGMALATHGSLTSVNTSSERAAVVKSVAIFYRSASKLAGKLAKRIRDRGSIAGVAIILGFVGHFTCHRGVNLLCCLDW